MEKERGGNRHEGKWEKVALKKRWEVLVGVERRGRGTQDEENGEGHEGEQDDEEKGAGDSGLGGMSAVGEYHGNGNGHEEDDEEKS